MQPNPPHVLIIDDHPMNIGLASFVLSSHGFETSSAADADEALQRIAGQRPDLILMDIQMPGTDGLSLTRSIRKSGVTMPILILTARDALQDRVQGLDLGADDYMVKPFELPEMLARLRALLRRSQAATSATLSFGALELDSANRQARANGQLIELGPREWTVMEYLLINAPKPASKDKLLQALTGWDKEITPNAIEVYISRLRSKLEPHGICVRSIRGFGYRLEITGAASSSGAE